MTFQKYIKYPNMVFLLKKDSNHGKQNDQLFHFPVSVGEEEYKVSLYQLQMELYVGAITPNYPFMRPFKGGHNSINNDRRGPPRRTWWKKRNTRNIIGGGPNISKPKVWLDNFAKLGLDLLKVVGKKTRYIPQMMF